MPVDIVYVGLKTELRQSEPRRRKCVGGEDVGSGVEILPLRVFDNLRLGEYENVDTALQVALVVREALAPVLLLGQSHRLEHHTPRAVENHHSLFEDAFDLSSAVRSCHGHAVSSHLPAGQTIVIDRT